MKERFNDDIKVKGGKGRVREEGRNEGRKEGRKEGGRERRRGREDILEDVVDGSSGHITVWININDSTRQI